MKLVKWWRFVFPISIGILSLSLISCLFSESTPVEWELDENFNKEPYKISFLAYNDSMLISVLPPRRASLQYCIRSLCGRTNPIDDNPMSVGGFFALDDTISVLWSNRSGDTLRTLVHIDRNWFADGIIVAGDTLRIRLPQGTNGSFNVTVWGKAGSGSARDAFREGMELMEMIAPSQGDWERLCLVELNATYVKDTIATSPVQYVYDQNYFYRDSILLLQPRCEGCSRE